MMSTFPLYAALPTPEEMRQWDEISLNTFGIPPVLLMENAAREAFAVLEQHVPLNAETRALVVMGGGNNGGDGAALARHLSDAGCKVLVYHIAPLESLRSPAREHAVMAQNVGVNFLPLGPKESLLTPFEWQSPTVIIDALTGTGIRGDLREKELDLVRAVNLHCRTSFIFSLDTPSGLCGYTGKPRPEAVRAHATVTFEAGKPGLFFPEAKEFTGHVSVRRIGMPQGVRTMLPSSWQLLAPEKGAWAEPSPLQHKGTAGKVLVIGGSEGMAGAPFLTALGSLRTGAGLVHVACPGGLEGALRAGCPELLTHAVGSGTVWAQDDAPALIELMRRIGPGAVAIGPGMGRTPAVRHIIKELLKEKKRPPLILDADALAFFRLPDALHPDGKQKHEEEGISLNLPAEKDILTPHPGEMAKMLPCSFFSGSSDRNPREAATLHACIDQMQEDRSGVMRVFTRACKAVLVLKGPGTLIGRHGAPVTLAPFAAPTLAVGGSGDVLTGACAALAASGMLSLDAACLGVYLHGKAGEILAERSLRGHLASDIANALPLAWKSLCSR